MTREFLDFKLRNLRFAVALSDINFKIGSVNPSGIGDEVYFTPKQNIAEWPEIADDFDTAESARAYVEYGSSTNTNFKMKEDKVWTRLYTTQGKGKITSESTGETDCKMFVNKASLSYPKINTEIRAFCKLAANGDFVFVVKHDGKFYVIGNPDYRATVTPNGDSGDAAGSAKGITIEIECPDTTPLPTYVGDLVLSDGTLDCSDGSFTASVNGN